jgi:diguanylate cyclase (GGDEF)-like protein
MQKDELKSIVTSLFESLLDEIEQEGDVTKNQVVNYLNDATKTISDLDEDITSDHQIKSLFANEYKNIAKLSLSSYQKTNEKFEELASIHKEAITSFSDKPIDTIDTSVLEKKFGEVQSFMTDEIKRANEVISNLKERIRTLEKTNNIDPLTKIFNRRALTSYVDKICSKNDSHHYNLYLLMVDLDNFKTINDTYGHVAGDKVLIFLANTLKKTLRDGDKLFRYGGEEFMIILNRINDYECNVIANRILDQIRSNKLVYQGKSLSVTVSIGVTKLSDQDDQESFISRADKAMYEAKKNGKNQIFWI